MDQIMIGNFIKQQRKEKGLTQTQLALKLNVSEKTISKWECGRGIPDTSIMLPLCEVLDISANELLSGKKISNENYKKEAENNLVVLKAEQERTSKLAFTVEEVLGYMSSITFFILIFVSSFVNLATWLRVLLIVVGFLHFIVGVHFCLLIEKDVGFYVCKHCKHKHIPTYKQILWSMHIGRTRYMRCPNCNKKSWQKKVLK